MLFWIVLGCVAIALWINLLDGPRVWLPPNPTFWQRARADGREFLIKLSAIAAVGAAGFLFWKMVA